MFVGFTYFHFTVAIGSNLKTRINITTYKKNNLVQFTMLIYIRLILFSTYIHTHIIHLAIETIIEMKKAQKYLDELYIYGVIKIALLKA